MAAKQKASTPPTKSPSPSPEARTNAPSAIRPGLAGTRINIIHFNDVYNIEPRAQEPVGGASRFTTAIKQLAPLDPLVLFSGDALNPSIMSTVTKGKQMVPILKGLGVQCAVYGNHDFDFGVDVLSKIASETEFPWLMSNVYDLTTDKPLADGLITHMITWKGVKIGLLGLVEEEWIETLATIDPEDVECLDFVEEGRDLARQLRQEGADYVIALTHMRWPNDIKLAENVAEIDLILGGHDHDYTVRQVNGKYVIKSGTDFRDLTHVALSFQADGSAKVELKQVTIDSSIPEDPEAKKTVQEFMEIMGAKMEAVIGNLDVELDGRFASIRTSETNLGNFVTDIMLEATSADVALLNSGTLRSDAIHPKGPFKIKDLMAILPMIDPLVVIKISGDSVRAFFPNIADYKSKQILDALENGVCKYPTLEGRFPQVAGLSFGFDPTRPPGERVDHRHIRIQGGFLDLAKFYSLVTKSYLANGKDGYEVFKDCPILVDEEDSPALTTAVQNHFKSVQILRGEKKAKSVHRQSIIPVARRKSLMKQMSIDEGARGGLGFLPIGFPFGPHPDGQRSPMSVSPARGAEEEPEHATPPRTRASLSMTGHLHSMSAARRTSIHMVEMEETSHALAPIVEGRIFIVKPTNRAALDEEWLAANMQRTTILEQNESPLSSPTL